MVSYYGIRRNLAASIGRPWPVGTRQEMSATKATGLTASACLCVQYAGLFESEFFSLRRGVIYASLLA